MPLIEECSDSSDDEQKEEVVPSEEADAAAKTRVVEGIRQGLHPACLGAWIDVPARKVREETKEPRTHSRKVSTGGGHACVLPSKRYECINTSIDIALPPHSSPNTLARAP